MLSSKQRAYLRALAAGEDTILIIGKGGITPNVTEQAAGALRKRELVKGRVLEASLLSSREACEILAQRCRAEPVACIGSRFVLYKRNEAAPRLLAPRGGKPAPRGGGVDAGRKKSAARSAGAPRKSGPGPWAARSGQRAEAPSRGGGGRFSAGRAEGRDRPGPWRRGGNGQRGNGRGGA